MIDSSRGISQDGEVDWKGFSTKLTTWKEHAGVRSWQQDGKCGWLLWTQLLLLLEEQKLQLLYRPTLLTSCPIRFSYWCRGRERRLTGQRTMGQELHAPAPSRHRALVGVGFAWPAQMNVFTGNPVDMKLLLWSGTGMDQERPKRTCRTGICIYICICMLNHAIDIQRRVQNKLR